MIKRPKPGETEEDIIRMQQEFLAEREKNPKMMPAAEMVKMEKAPKKSLFAQNREKELQMQPAPPMEVTETTEPSEIVNQIHQHLLGRGDMKRKHVIADVILGDIVEKTYVEPKASTDLKESSGFPEIDKTPIRNFTPTPGKSIFALCMEAKLKLTSGNSELPKDTDKMDWEPMEKKLNTVYGNVSTIVEDTKTGAEVHRENLEILSKIKEEYILEERKKLLESMDPSLVALLAKKRQEKSAIKRPSTNESTAIAPETSHSANKRMEMEITTEADPLSVLPPSNAALDILERSSAEKWIHFDVVETDKLEWLRDVPEQMKKLQPGEQFEARFDWKGVLLPYSTAEEESVKAVATSGLVKDERELYLHGAEPERPGYTLQELFRLARSNIAQQRVTAFGAIAGILNIYNQGFYDQVLELPITKIFFLIRFGLDDNTPAMLEVVSKALAFLLYNETDEALLDFIYDNPGCHWQPTLQVLATDSEASDDPTSIENLQKQMRQLKVDATIKANIEENEEESKTTMSDFQLAETDLIDCLLRTNILQRIYFILHSERLDNSTVSSCLKVLIRLARSGKEVALQIVNHEELIKCLLDNFVPNLERVDTLMKSPPFYNYPQHLCLKLIRILISQNLGIALKFVNLQIVDKLQNYLFNRDDIKGQLIKAQIESLRILRCLLLLGVDNTLYKKFLPGFRYMLEWHFNHGSYEVGGPFLIRQHAAALLATIASGPGGLDVKSLLGDMLHDCCCSWFHKATRSGVKEFSQTTILSACLNAVAWYTRSTDSERFRNFGEKYLREFIATPGFLEFVKSLVPSSIILRTFTDRRSAHTPLPCVGSVLMHNYGPQLIVPQTYSVFFLNALWRLLEVQLERQQNGLLDALIQPSVVEPLVCYLRELTTKTNRYLATNFFAKTEIKFIFKLLCFKGFTAYFEKAQMLQIVYNFLCCLTAEHIPEIEVLFERVIFNKEYIDESEETLKKWRNACLELVYPHYIVVSPSDLTLSLPSTQAPILPSDWPYFQLKILLQNYIDNVQMKQTEVFSEREILLMTFSFVGQLEQQTPLLQITTPTEKLMYLMIAFMGPDSQFLEPDMRQLLQQHLQRFYEQCDDQTFHFDAVYEGKCKFENLYALFVDHFQAASYGDDLFGSLVFVPLAQKYDNKWRRRLWSDYASALRFLHCDESLLLGGLKAYLEPPEQEESLLKEYSNALNTNLVRPNTLPYIIAKHHVDKFKESLERK